MDKIAIGIDLGTLFSRVAYFDRRTGRARLIPNEEGSNQTPSLVAFDGSRLVTGTRAAHLRRAGGEAAVLPKRHLEEPGVPVHVGGRAHTSTDLLSALLSSLKQDAEREVDAPLAGAVLAVRAQAGQAARDAYIAAAVRSGLPVLGLIAEPVAAVIGCGLHATGHRERILVASVGAGSADFSVVECDDGKPRLRSACGSAQLGGIEQDRVVAGYLLDKAGGAGAAAGDAGPRLMELAAQARLGLSKGQSLLLSLPLGEDVLEVELSRSEMERALGHLVDEIERLCLRAVEEAGLAWADLTQAVLSGGVLRTPIIGLRLRQLLDEARLDPRTSEEAIALGAAVHAGALLDGLPSADLPTLAGAGPFVVAASPATMDELALGSGKDAPRIQLCMGDLTALGEEDAVDVLVVSAFPDDYTPLPGSLIGDLDRLGVSVAELARHKEADLRGAFSCWMSRELLASAPRLHFRRVLCFEPLVRGDPPELVGDIFRSLAPFVGGSPPVRRVAMPLVAAGYQGFLPEEMLRQIVTAAAHWMSVGLPLNVLKVVVRPGPNLDSVRECFKRLRDELSLPAAGLPRSHTYDLFLSYAHANSDEVLWFRQELEKCRPGLRVFLDRQQLDVGAAWQQRIFEALDDCARVVAFYSPAYLDSKVCKEEFNIALCRHRESRESILAPIYLYTAQLPTYMRLIQYTDCREYDRPRLRQVAAHLAGAPA